MIAGNHVHESTKSRQDVYDLLHEYAINTVVFECIPADDDKIYFRFASPLDHAPCGFQPRLAHSHPCGAYMCGSHTDLPICRVEELHDSPCP